MGAEFGSVQACTPPSGVIRIAVQPLSPFQQFRDLRLRLLEGRETAGGLLGLPQFPVCPLQHIGQSFAKFTRNPKPCADSPFANLECGDLGYGYISLVCHAVRVLPGRVF